MKQLRGLDFDPRLKTKVSVGKQFPFERDWFFSEEIPHEKMQKMATFQSVQILNFFEVRRGETACKVAKLCANKYLALVPFSLHRSFALSPSQTTANKPPASQAMIWICVRNSRSVNSVVRAFFTLIRNLDLSKACVASIIEMKRQTLYLHGWNGKNASSKLATPSGLNWVNN